MEPTSGSDRPVRVPIEDALDLHGFDPRETAALVEEYLHAAAEAGFREVRIIHGKGIGVQRRIVESVLRRHPLVVGFSLGGPGRGEWGATIVTLRRPSN